MSRSAFVLCMSVFLANSAIAQTAGSWGIDRLDERTLPLDGLYRYVGKGAGVTVYVIDTGVSPVSELSGRLKLSESFVAGDPNPADCVGEKSHGTKVAVIIAGATLGVAQAAEIVSFKVADCGFTPVQYYGSSVKSAIERVIELHKATNHKAIINFSGVISDDLTSVIESALQANITIVTASSDAQGCPDYPSILGSKDGVITVAASTNLDSLRVGGGRGPCVDIFAPGEAITTVGIGAYGTGQIDTNFSGASAAAPHVSGVIAQYLEHQPVNYAPRLLEESLKTNATVGQLNIPPSSDTKNRLASVLINDCGLPPTITSQPQSQTSPAGQQVALSVAAQGATSYWWYQGESGDTSQSIFDRSGGASSTIYVYPTHTTKYWVKVTNSCASGSTLSATAEVAVQNSYSVRLQTYYGNYASAASCGGSNVNGIATAAGACETFTLKDLNYDSLRHGDQITLRAYNGYYVVAELGGCADSSFPLSSCAVNANRASAAAWETFTIHKVNCGYGCQIISGDLVTLKSWNGYFVSAEYGGANGPSCGRCFPFFNANRQSAAAWETFRISW